MFSEFIEMELHQLDMFSWKDLEKMGSNFLQTTIVGKEKNL